MKKYRVKYDFNEEIEIEADTEKEAEKMAWEMLRATIHECGFGVDVEEIEDEEEE